MDVLLVNTYDSVGGASRAAVRLLEGLRRHGVASRLLVQFKDGADDGVVCRGGAARRWLRRLKTFLGTLPVRRYPNRPENNFTPAVLPDTLASEVERLAPDVVHLHWLGAGLCRLETLAELRQPLVWTLHDSWPFTGGCHVPPGCERYRQRCGACPVLGSESDADLSRRTWQRKRSAWRNLRPTLVAPSRWMADCARSSSLLGEARVEVIPNGLDTEAFRPVDRKQARALLGLSPDAPLILFGAVRGTTDPNKGWRLLEQALRLLAPRLPGAGAAVFGEEAPARLPDVGMPLAFLGRLSDDATLAAAYSAADVFAVPSLREAFCQTAAEAMACGTPVVAFGSTGLLDVVTHGHDGYLARPYEAEDLADGLAWVLADGERRARFGAQARRSAEAKFGLAAVAARHAALYAEVAAAAEREAS